ncbi:MAG: hypothetical protein HYS09_08150 [Chloroflexi bacterium]|nr:hypothetical protein [Chloroflexota bacterium]
MLAIFVALAAEQRCVQPYIEELERKRLNGFSVVLGHHRNRPLLLCRTGLGRRAKDAADLVLNAHRAQAVVSLGFSGAVRHDLRGGEIVVCERVYLCPDGEREAEALQEADESLLMLAERAVRAGSLHSRKGASATVPQALVNPAQKRELGEKCPVDIVEMESFWVGQAANAHGAPFLTVRAVVDDAAHVVPDAEELVTELGDQRVTRIIRLLATRPTYIPHFLRLTRNGMLAGRQLGRFAGEFISQWSGLP